MNFENAFDTIYWDAMGHMLNVSYCRKHSDSCAAFLCRYIEKSMCDSLSDWEWVGVVAWSVVPTRL